MFSKIKELKDRIFKGYSRYDLMDIDYWFQTTFVNMLSDFEKSIFGSPEVTFEDIKDYDINWVNENYKDIIRVTRENKFFSEKYKDLEEFETENFEDGIYDHFIAWKLILRRIAYCLKESSEDQCGMTNEYWDKYWNLVFDRDYKNDEEREQILELPEIKELDKKVQERWKEIDEYKTKMKDEAFELLSKWFFALWN